MSKMYAIIVCFGCAVAPKMRGVRGEELRQCLVPTIVVSAWNVNEVNEVREAVEWWNDEFVWGGKTNLLVSDAGEGFVLVGMANLDEGVCGVTSVKADGRGCIVKAVVKVGWMCEDAIEEVVRHELGHALGYDHAGYGVMRPTVDTK